MGLFGKRSSPTVIGIIADTHGPLPRPVMRELVGVDHVICAGDILSADVVPTLRRIAKQVTVVRGNMDQREPTRALPETAVAEVDGKRFYVLHDLSGLDLDPCAAGFDAVIHGHTHRAEIEWRDEVLFLNPGSAADPRSRRRATIAKVVIEAGVLNPAIIEVD